MTRFDKKKCIDVLRDIYTSRYTDDKMGKLVRQNKGATFQLSAAGHELIGVVAAKSLIPGKDWALPYYRDQPFAIGLGCSLTDIFGAFLARNVHHHSAGRMMPGHFSHKELRIPCQSSVVGSQFLHAVGIAKGIKFAGKDEVVYVSSGEGATSQGDFHEALNFAGIHQLPVIFVVQDNKWAISVPISEQTAGGTIVHVARGHQGVEAVEVNGSSYEELSSAMEAAVKRARSGQGPTVLIAHVPRIAPHSSSDDPQKYKLPKDFETDKHEDPLPTYEAFLLAHQLATAEEIAAVKTNVFKAVEEAAVEADKIPFPDVSTVGLHVFKDEEVVSFPNECPISDEKIVIMDAVNHAIDEEMERNPSVVVFGQDVAHGKGGVFGLTKNLSEKYGDRCFNTPLAESTIIGLTVGLSISGLRPVAEIQFADYLWTGINQLFNELSSIHYRSNGEWNCPSVIRMPCGGYIQGGPYHSQSIEGYLSHCPGLIVVIPSNAADAKGLMKMAMRSTNPVVFLEHKALYRQQKFSARAEPSKDYLLPFGKANIVKSGDDLTIVAWGMTVLMSLEAAEKLGSMGISCEIIDLRTIVPFDSETVLTSVKKTGKLLIVQEAARNCGFGAEIAAQVIEKAFQFLDAPIERVCALDTPVPYCKPLEAKVLPQVSDIEQAIIKLAQY